MALESFSFSASPQFNVPYLSSNMILTFKFSTGQTHCEDKVH